MFKEFKEKKLLIGVSIRKLRIIGRNVGYKLEIVLE